jgi:hypothetical protein
VSSRKKLVLCVLFGVSLLWMESVSADPCTWDQYFAACNELIDGRYYACDSIGGSGSVPAGPLYCTIDENGCVVDLEGFVGCTVPYGGGPGAACNNSGDCLGSSCCPSEWHCWEWDVFQIACF